MHNKKWRIIIKGKLIRGIGGKYLVVSKNKTYNCFPRKKTKKDNKLIIGDEVEFLEETGSYYIDKIYARKNQLVRPKIANIDSLVIILAPTPKPDLLLIDKMLLYAFIKKIDVVLVINKEDITDTSFIDDIKAQYKESVNNIVVTSALKNNGINNLLKVLKGKFSVFAGQSAVGKSTILNAINSDFNLETGLLSRKTERGKHTTRHTEIFRIDEDTFIADTPGFSLLELDDVEPNKLHELFMDFNELRKECKYRTCNHIQMLEKECAVKRAVTSGKFNEERYKRYVTLYEQIKKRWDKKYD